MALIEGKWIEDGAVNADKIKLQNDVYLKARNQADDADVNIVKVNTSNALEFASTPQVGGVNVALVNDIPPVFDVQGNWDANTNSPTLVSSTNSTGDTYPLYIVSVSGTTTLDGISTWDAGDWVYFANGVWNRADNIDDVVSVNGQSGTVVLDTDDISEGATNLYFTDARVIAAPLTGFVAGSNTAIAATDTVLEAFQKTQGQINALSSASTLANNVVLTLNSTDITNGYKDLAHEATTVLYVAPLGGLKQELGVDYTLSVVSTVTRITFAGDLATLLVDGDKLLVEYLY